MSLLNRSMSALKFQPVSKEFFTSPRLLQKTRKHSLRFRMVAGMESGSLQFAQWKMDVKSHIFKYPVTSMELASFSSTYTKTWKFALHIRNSFTFHTATLVDINHMNACTVHMHIVTISRVFVSFQSLHGNSSVCHFHSFDDKTGIVCTLYRILLSQLFIKFDFVVALTRECFRFSLQLGQVDN